MSNESAQPCVDKPMSSLVDGIADIVAELTDKLQAGEPIDVSPYFNEHPEWADRLNALLPALQMMASVGQASEPADSAAGLKLSALEDNGEFQGTLGDFRIVRQIARGGMGIVYEAEQVSLRRRVALKVLPMAGALDTRHLQRFKNEAQAAAGLHHTNIVPVFYVGCDRGIHYYAMQYIEGQSLAALISDMRRREKGESAPVSDADYSINIGSQPSAAQTVDLPPTIDATPTEALAASTAPIAAISTEHSTKNPAYFQSVAKLAIQAAEALEHAHQMGVVHRDIKPGNLLLDERGNLWVADFGLAQFNSEANLTMTGDILGTLRYMSPEQSLAQRVIIDHRTDIYSLGVTLYELLTLRPAIAGKARPEILRQIAFEDPKSPRRINRTIPPELETIVMKAMEKNPADRYQTAQGLADDLRRFTEDKPIHARRPGIVARVRKWSRRHTAAVAAAAVCLLVAVTAVAGSVGWILSDRAAQHRQLGDAVERALDDAVRFQTAKNWSEARAATLRAQSLLATGAGDEERSQRVSQLLRDLNLIARLEQIQLEQASVKDGRFDDDGAFASYAMAFRDYGIDVETLEAEEAAARIRSTAIAAEATAGLDDWARITPLDKARLGKHVLAIARQADLENDPWRQRLRLALEQGEPQTIVRLASEAEHKTLAPSTVLLLTAALLNESTLSKNKTSKQDRVKLAVALLRKSQMQHPDHIWINHYLAFHLHHNVQPPQLDEAVGFYRAALALRSHSPGIFQNLGSALREKGDLTGALAAFHKAIAIKPDYAEPHNSLGVLLCDKKRDYEGALSAFQNAIKLKPDFADAHHNLGVSLAGKGDLAGAIVAFQKAIALKPEHALAHLSLGQALHAKKDLAGAIAAFQKAIGIKADFVHAHYSLGNALLDKKDLTGAIAAYQQAIGHDAEFVKAHFGLGVALHYKRDLTAAIAAYQKAIALKPDYAEAHCNLASALDDKGDSAGAIAAYQRAIALKPDFAMAHSNLGVALKANGDLPGAIAAYQKAIALKPEYAEAYCNLGSALDDKGDSAGAISAFQKAITLKSDFAMAHYGLGLTLSKKGDLAGTIAAYEKAIALKPDYPDPHCNLAYQLANFPDLKLRDVPRAVKLAKKAVELAPKRGNIWGVLGMVHYRAGDPKAAVEALEKCMEIGQGGDNDDWFFLAMSFWQLGEKELARKWYDRAAQRMDKNQPQDSDLRRFRAEAAQLLGVPEAPKKGEDPKTERKEAP